MPFSDPSLTGLTANITLPVGMSGKARMFSVGLNRRWKDSEGFDDAGYATGKLTGQRLAGRIAGFINAGDPGFATVLENVSCSFTAESGRVITGNIDVTDIEWGAAVGEMQTFTANFISNGPFSPTL